MKEKENCDYGISIKWKNVARKAGRWGRTESGPPFCSRARPFWFRDTLKDRCIEPVDVLLGLSAVH